MSRPIHVVLALASCGLAAAAHAQSSISWFGGAGLTSDRIERGLSQSARKPSLDAHLGLRHEGGLYASLGAASVSDEQYVGSDGYKLMPEIGWSYAFGRAFGEADDWRAGVSLRGQFFPGARGPWFGSLPPRLQAVSVRANDSDYQTAELGVSLGWKIATLSVTRSLTDYLGLSATETGPAGTRVLESRGTTYVGLDLDWPLTDQWSLNAGAGRLTVPNFDGLDYTDWRLGAAYQWHGLRVAVQASGSDAPALAYRVRDRSGGETGASETVVTAGVGWVF